MCPTLCQVTWFGEKWTTAKQTAVAHFLPNPTTVALAQSARTLTYAARQAAILDFVQQFYLHTLFDTTKAKLRRYVVRLASNCTARLNQLPPSKSCGRPCAYGVRIRPLPRSYRGKPSPPHPRSVEIDGRMIRYAVWRGLVTAKTKVAKANPTFAILVFWDPLYKTPLVLATDLNLLPEPFFRIYRDRWPVEHPPLAAKQMIGLHRQFVSSPASCYRLPELALLAGNLLTHSAASLPPVPTGFWDRMPKTTPGRLRRFLAKAIFPDFSAFAPQFRKKNSVFHHLSMGILAHRRCKRVA